MHDAAAIDRRPASERYALEPFSHSRVRIGLRVVVVLVANLLTRGAGPVNPGGTGLRIVDRDRGTVVGEVRERLGDDGPSPLDTVRDDLVRLDADAFAARWVTG